MAGDSTRSGQPVQTGYGGMSADLPTLHRGRLGLCSRGDPRVPAPILPTRDEKMNWKSYAERLAAMVTPRGSRWREPVASIPRHLLIPRWWDTPAGARFGTWEWHDGQADQDTWMRTAYRDQTVITQVAGVHADHAGPHDHPDGWPTSSSTLPSLVVRMLRHGEIYQGADVLDVATGPGYSTAILSRLLGDHRVTSIDVDPYLVRAATARLDEIGLCPKVLTMDATGPLPGEYDRIVSMVSVRPIPESWVAALRPGGRLVTVIAGTSLIVTGTKQDNGWVEGRVEWDRAMFMPARSGAGDYPPGLGEIFAAVREQRGEEVGRGRYPVVCVSDAWELNSMLEVVAPGIAHSYEEKDGRRTAWMVHQDGSWARASAVGDEPPVVHQSGPRRLWDLLDEIRHQWLVEGSLPVYGARVFIPPSGVILLARGKWKGRIA